MLESITDLLLGAIGTVGYLYAWNRVLAANRADEGDDPETLRRARWRTRWWQLCFFVVLTPYVLLMYYLMELAR